MTCAVYATLNPQKQTKCIHAWSRCSYIYVFMHRHAARIYIYMALCFLLFRAATYVTQSPTLSLTMSISDLCFLMNTIFASRTLYWHLPFVPMSSLFSSSIVCY